MAQIAKVGPGPPKKIILGACGSRKPLPVWHQNSRLCATILASTIDPSFCRQEPARLTDPAQDHYVGLLSAEGNTFMLPPPGLLPLPPQSSQLSAAWLLVKLRLRGGSAAEGAAEAIIVEAGGSWYGRPSTSAFNLSR